MKTLILTVAVIFVIVLISVFLLGFKIWIFKDGKFPNIHIGGSKALSDQGVSCATSQDKEAQKSTKSKKYDYNKLLDEIEEL